LIDVLVERQIVFQTIKVGELLRKEHHGDDPYEVEFYDSFFYDRKIIPIADVLPFHIVGGHITTDLMTPYWDILFIYMDPRGKLSKPIKVSLSKSEYPYSTLYTAFYYLDLEPIINPKKQPITTHEKTGVSKVTGGHDLERTGPTLNPITKLDRITHIFLSGNYPYDNGLIGSNNEFLTMTLILEKEDE